MYRVRSLPYDLVKNLWFCFMKHLLNRFIICGSRWFRLRDIVWKDDQTNGWTDHICRSSDQIRSPWVPATQKAVDSDRSMSLSVGRQRYEGQKSFTLFKYQLRLSVLLERRAVSRSNSHRSETGKRWSDRRLWREHLWNGGEDE